MDRKEPRASEDSSLWEDQRERKRLFQLASSIPRLEAQCAIANEGYVLIRQAARKARAEADASELKAERVWSVLQARLIKAREAELRLKALLPEEQLKTWEAAWERMREIQRMLQDWEAEGACLEHLEAALEHAEASWRKVSAGW